MTDLLPAAGKSRLKESRFQKFSRGNTTGPPPPRGFAPLVLAGSDFAPPHKYLYLFILNKNENYVRPHILF